METPTSALVRRTDLLRSGWSVDEIRSRLRSGELEKVYSGVYRQRRGDSERSGAPGSSSTLRPAEIDLRAERELIEAVAARSDAVVVSDRSAAILHGIAVPHAEPRTFVVHVTRKARSGGNTRKERRVHARPLRDIDVVTIGAVRATSVARTCLDLACTLPPRDSVPSIDHVLHARMAFGEDLVDGLARATGRVGVNRARRAFALADGRSESFGESLLRVVLADLGIAVADLQVVVRAPNGAELGRVDIALPDCGVLIEFDGDTKYLKFLRPGQSASDVVVKEKNRENRIAECGYVVIRVVWADLFRPDELRVRLERAVERGRRAVASGLITGRLIPDRPIRLPI